MPPQPAPDASLTVITVTLNHLSGLAATWQSVRPILDANDCWIVIDGGSTDGTRAWLTALCRTSPGVRFVSSADSGPYDGMNRGTCRATGDYLVYLNAGDRFVEGLCRHELDRHLREADWPDILMGSAIVRPGPAHIASDQCGGQAGQGRGQRCIKRPRQPSSLRLGLPTHHQAMLFRRDCLSARPYRTRYRIAADYDLVVRLFLDGARIVPINTPLCHFEGGGLSKRRARRGRLEQAVIRRRHLATRPVFDQAIRFGQAIAMAVASFAPRLYRVLRFLRHNSG